MILVYLDISVVLVVYMCDCIFIKIMEKMLMVKFEEFWVLVDYYKGKIIESILLDKVVCLIMEV